MRSLGSKWPIGIIECLTYFWSSEYELRNMFYWCETWNDITSRCWCIGGDDDENASIESKKFAKFPSECRTWHVWPNYVDSQSQSTLDEGFCIASPLYCRICCCCWCCWWLCVQNVDAQPQRVDENDWIVSFFCWVELSSFYCHSIELSLNSNHFSLHLCTPAEVVWPVYTSASTSITSNPMENVHWMSIGHYSLCHIDCAAS